MADKPIPEFLRKEGDSVLFNNKEGEFVFFVPEVFFDSGKVASILGSKVRLFGILNYAIYDKNGKAKKLVPFTYPTVFETEPYSIDKVKGINLNKLLVEASVDDYEDYDEEYDPINDQEADPDLNLDDLENTDYRLLRYKYGNKIVVSTKTPQSNDNIEYFFNLFFLTAKFPTSLPYNTLHEYFIENAHLNDFDYSLNMQNFGIAVSEICRDKKDPSRPFRLSKPTNMTDYMPMSIKMTPKYVSAYTSITSENFDTSVMGAVLSDNKTPTPLEKVIMM